MVPPSTNGLEPTRQVTEREREPARLGPIPGPKKIFSNGYLKPLASFSPLAGYGSVPKLGSQPIDLSYKNLPS